LQPTAEPEPVAPRGPLPGQGDPPPRQGGNSGGHIMGNFVEALARKDVRAAYDCTSTAYQQRQPFAEFERAVRASKILDGPKPLQVHWAGPDAQGRQPAEVRFDRVPLTVPPLLRAVCLGGETGWWVEQIEWVPGAGEQALAQLKAKPEVKKEAAPNSPHGVATYFVELLQKGDRAGAYALTTKRYQAEVSRAQFEAAVAASAALRGKDKLGVYFGGSGPTVAYNVRPAHLPPQTPPAFVVRVLQEDRQWRVERIDWAKP
jgi:hypothetical protein